MQVKKYKGGLVVLIVDKDDDPDKALAFAREQKATFSVKQCECICVHFSSGDTEEEIKGHTWSASAFPSAFRSKFN